MPTSTDPLDRVYTRDSSTVARVIAGETILVPIRKNVADLHAVYHLNETATFAWQSFDGIHSLYDVRHQVTGKFNVDPDRAGLDLLELVEKLQQAGVLVEM